MALDDPSRPNADADLARSLRAAWSPQDLPEATHRAIVERALTQFDARRRPRGGNRPRLWYAGSVLALAAGVCFVVWAQHRARGTQGGGAVAIHRSAQPLFRDPFAAVGGETSRIDRIAMARGADLRDNEFTRWGVGVR
jgi:hypothetical protein